MRFFFFELVAGQHPSHPHGLRTLDKEGVCVHIPHIPTLVILPVCRTTGNILELGALTMYINLHNNHYIKPTFAKIRGNAMLFVNNIT